jgi:signal transduction histidine kinase
LLDAEGQLLQAKKMYPEAISKFKQAAELFSKTGFVVHLSYQYYHLARCHQALGNLSESFRNANHAFEIATEENWTGIKIGASLLLSELYAQSHNMPKAYEYLKLHKTIKDEDDSKDETSRAADFETQSLLNQHQRKIDLLEKNTLLAEIRSSQESLRKNFAFAGIGVILLGGGYGFYRYKKRKKLQSQKALMNERLRISRELHDEVGATLSGIAMYSHLTKEQIKNAETSEVEKSLNVMQQSAGEMVNKLNDIVWLINPDQDSLQKLIQRLEEYAADMGMVKNMQVKVNTPAHLPEHSLPVESRRNIYLFCKEAINNAVKYSEGSLLELNIKEVGDKLEFSVSDNGKGFDAVMVRRGNGLENMQKRADEIGAKLLLQSKKDEGSLLSMQLKIT